MYHIEYATLNYYPMPVSDECMCMGVLIHNITTGQRDFKSISNFRRFQAFDDEADVNFVKSYLAGIKEDVETSIFNYREVDAFNIQTYIRFFANEFKFSVIRQLNVEEMEDYVNYLVKLYLKYDFPKSQRLNDHDEKKMLKLIFADNNWQFSSGKIKGQYEDEIAFDYQMDNLYIKFFSFQGKNLRRLVCTARQWSFAAEELCDKGKVLFIYDSSNEDQENMQTIISILSKYAKVLQWDSAVEYISKEREA